MIICSQWIVQLAVLAVGPAVELEELRNVMESMQQKMSDVECVYEGAADVGSPWEKESAPADRITFQGVFAWRMDGFAYSDLYVRNNDPADLFPMSRRVTVLRDHFKVEELKFQPDRGKPSELHRKTAGGLPSLFEKYSAFRFFLTPALLEYLRDTGGIRTENHFRYEFKRWEILNGQKCLMISFIKDSQNGGMSVEYSFWIDLARGGSVVKYEFRMDGELWASVSNVHIKEIATEDGRKHWFPVSGTYESFLVKIDRQTKKPIVADSPLMRESYTLVAGTLRINQGLSKERFSLKWSGTVRDAHLQTAMRDYDAMYKQSRGGGKRSVESAIALADRQVTLLSASAPSRENWFVTNLSSIVLVVFGLTAIGGALKIWRYQR